MISESVASSGYNCLGLTKEPDFLRKEEIDDIFELLSENWLKRRKFKYVEALFSVFRGHMRLCEGLLAKTNVETYEWLQLYSIYFVAQQNKC